MPDAARPCAGSAEMCAREAFDTAELKCSHRPLWEDVDDKIRYLARFQETDAETGNTVYRVFAYARKAMHPREWTEAFAAFAVRKIGGDLEHCDAFTSRLNLNVQQMVASQTIKQMAAELAALKHRPLCREETGHDARGMTPVIQQRHKKTKKKAKRTENV